MHIERVRIDLTTDDNGNATAYSSVVTGSVLSLHYVKTDFADGVDFVVTGEALGQAILSQDNVNASVGWVPRQATCDVLGAASLYAAGGEPVEVPVYLARDRIKAVISNGGAVKTGAIYALIG